MTQNCAHLHSITSLFWPFVVDGTIASFPCAELSAVLCVGADVFSAIVAIALSFSLALSLFLSLCIHSAVLGEDGHVYTFGCNTSGQLGLGTKANVYGPKRVQWPRPPHGPKLDADFRVRQVFGDILFPSQIFIFLQMFDQVVLLRMVLCCASDDFLSWVLQSLLLL
eukprot:COSAG05_NODE_49_length_24373_cov_16.162561_12_plen_167_part_00